MKPMELKEPTKCCGSPRLAWQPEGCYYICPCGQMKATSGGRLVGRRRFNNYNLRSRNAK